LGQDDALLSVQEIHTYYADSYVLQGLSLELQKGRIVAILGRNGMGKTTLVRSVAGLTPPRAGNILFDGKPIHELAPYEIARRGIALVPQGRRIFKSLSVLENLLLPSSRMAVGRRAAPKGTTTPRWDQEEVLNQFPQLRERIRNLGTALSGGEQQMLAIARALMTNPDLILMDEPSEGLAPRIVQQVGEILIGLRERNHSILLVEQNLGLALSVAD
jgi:branched-chain amino acid transport system ATP-binding protein